METLCITWLEDIYKCETCGTSYAEGARVEFGDGNVLLNLVPKAHCYEEKTFPSEYVYNKILEKLGFNVIESVGT